MTVLTLALLAGSQPAAPRLAPVHQIGPQSRRQSPHTPCAPLVRTDAFPLTWQKADRQKRSAPPSSSHTPWPNPHSACGTAAAPLPAISCLGAFRPPAARARGEVRHCRQPKTCTEEVAGAAAMVVIEMREADDIIIVAFGRTEVLPQLHRQVDPAVPGIGG